MYHTIHSQIVCRSVSDKIFNFQVHFRCMSLSSSPSWSSAPWTLWGQYFWSSIWIVYLIWGSGSLAVLHTYMEALVCWSVSDRIFNLQVHFWCLLLSPSLSSGPRHNGAILLWSHIQTLFILFVWSLAVFHIYMEAHAVISNFQVHFRCMWLLSLLSWRFCPRTYWGSSIFSNHNWIIYSLTLNWKEWFFSFSKVHFLSNFILR